MKILIRISFLALSIVFSHSSLALDAYCAKVKIEILQELTLERQGFEAIMRISNGLDTFSLDDVAVDILFKDEDDKAIIASSDPTASSSDAVDFYIRLDDTTNISGIAQLEKGSITGGKIEPASEAEIKWLIIPVPGAAKENPTGKLYFVGASLRYSYGGKDEVVDIAPDTIIVKPLPKLTLDYFLTEHVFGDDAFTDQIEPIEPYTLGIRIANNGFGPANNVKLDSAQPKIVENKQGLSIGFNIAGSYVNDAPAEPSLLLDFGDIAASGRTMGRWIMETTLSGKFVEFSATVSHAAEFGGELTSLIEGANTHFLLRDVQVDAAGRDDINDFLAHSGDASELWVYESENLSLNNSTCDDCSPVFQLGASLSAVQETPNGSQHILTPASQEASFAFVKIADPYDGSKILSQAISSNGKVLLAQNAWLGKERNEDKINFDHFIYVFDQQIASSYALLFADQTASPKPPVIQFIADKTTFEGGQIGFLVRASDPNGDAVNVTIESMPLGAEFDFSFTDNLGKGVFNWFPQLGQKGSYPVTFIANDGALTTTFSLVITVNSSDDTDGDGLDDDWERLHFGDLSRDGTGDFDNDGYSDLEEFNKGWNPLEPAKVPNVPLISFPSFDGEVSSLTPVLSIINSSHSDDIEVTYSYEFFADSALAELVLRLDDVVEGQDTTDVELTALSDGTALLDNHVYFWRVRGVSAEGSSEWAQSQFFVNTQNDQPDVAQLSSPQNGGIVSDSMPILSVNNVQDVDRDAVRYHFSVYSDASLSDVLFEIVDLPAGDAGITEWQLPEGLTEDTQYFWQVEVLDEHDSSSLSSVFTFLFSSQNNAPESPVIHLPSDTQEVESLTPALSWQSSSDPEGNELTYDVQWSIVADFSDFVEVLDLSVSGEIGEYTLPLLDDNSRYYWRVRANDGELTSNWARAEFFVNTVNDAPNSVSVANPADNSIVELLQPSLSVNPVLDVDNDQVSYLFEIYSDAAMTDLLSSKKVADVFWQVDIPLLDNAYYYWHARAIDEHGAEGNWTPPHQFFVNNGGINDTPEFTFLSPAANIELIDGDVLIQWSDGDPDSNAQIALWYEGDNSEVGIIVENINEDLDGESDQYLWHVSDLPVGTYNIKAIIEDEESRIDIVLASTVTVLSAEGHVVVSVVGGSVLDEAGHDQVVVEISLDRAPQVGTQVTMNLSSSDNTEGTITAITQDGLDKPLNYLYFNADNWDMPYRIVLQGIDDCEIDGDVEFDLVLAPFVSADEGFDGRDSADVTITTTDNEDPEQTLFMCSYTLVSKTIVGDKVEVSYQASLMNTGEDLAQVHATLGDSELFSIKGSDTFVFHSVAAGGRTLSSDVITIIYDPNISLGSKDLTWDIEIVQANSNELPSGWSNDNVGLLWTAGGISVSNGKYQITGAGSDVWGLADGFHFAYRSLTGDGEIVAQINSLSNTHAWAKAGVMIRESNWIGSKHASFIMTPAQGLDFQYRSTTSWITRSHGVKSADMGSWLKLVRLGNSFSAYRSVDGINWALVNTQQISMDSTVNIGLGITSHSWFKNATAEFENVSVEQY
jgi:hypothetical protein